jgi:GNAT superfamily N-acetyltransferase
MAWETTGDVHAFLAAAGEFLRAHAAENTGLLTVSEMVALRGPNTFGDEAPEFGWWRADGRVMGAFAHTPPYPVLLGSAPLAAGEALIAALADRPLAGVNGPVDVARAVAAAYPVPSAIRRRERLYRLGGLIDPPAPPGRAVVAGAAQREQLIAWYGAFAAEIGEPARDWSGMVDERLSHDGLFVWESPPGEPVGFAGMSRQIARMVRVSPVYTPPAERGRGLAAALTAAVCRSALAAGAADVLLFADLANPTSNRVYRRIGFTPVSDRLVIDFEA